MQSESQLDRLTQRLRECLGRIDAAAFRCQTDGSAIDHEATVEQLGTEADQLQQLVTSLIEAANAANQGGTADLNQIVHRAVQQTLHQCRQPVLLRSRLAGSLPAVGCRPVQVAHAVQRALQLGLGHAGHGGAVDVATRCDDEQVVFELQAEGEGSAETRNRAATLAEFVASCGGRCRIDRDETGVLLLSLELPTVDVVDNDRFD